MIIITYLTKEKLSLNYEDITEKWLSKAKENNHKVKELNIYIQGGTSYKVDEKNKEMILISLKTSVFCTFSQKNPVKKRKSKKNVV